MKVLNRELAQCIDRMTSEEYKLPSLILMENAALNSYHKIISYYKPDKVAILAGPGNNGGDGLALSRHLHNNNIDVVVYLLADRDKLSGDALVNFLAAQKFCVKIKPYNQEIFDELKYFDIIVDAIFGIGLSKPMEGIYRTVVDELNSLNKTVISLDIPSGIDADTGQVLGTAVCATKTFTFGLPKLGIVIYPGASYAGEVEVIPISLPKKLIDSQNIPYNLLTKEEVSSLLPKHPPWAHKYQVGKLVVVAGKLGMSGAGILCAQASLRTGAGIVYFATAENVVPIIQEAIAEVIAVGVAQTQDGAINYEALGSVLQLLDKANALVIGPGLGRNPQTVKFVRALIENTQDIPTVLDGDGLFAVGGCADLLAKRRHIILTPHSGELARLLNVEVEKINKAPIEAAREAQKKFNNTIVLKSARTIIATENHQFYINQTGNVGMATAGAGDVLSGMIGSFLAQRLSCTEAACLGVYLHGLAGDIAKNNLTQYSLAASDIIKYIPQAIKNITTS